MKRPFFRPFRFQVEQSGAQGVWEMLGRVRLVVAWPNAWFFEAIGVSLRMEEDFKQEQRPRVLYLLYN